MPPWPRPGRDPLRPSSRQPRLAAGPLLAMLLTSLTLVGVCERARAADAVATTSPSASSPIKPFTGTLQTIYERGQIRLGHRLNSPPFAFLGPGARPIGYSLDICEVVVEAIARHLHRAVDVQWVPVTPSNRFDLVRNGQVDLECGSSTANAERREIVAFSPTLFVTGTRLLVRRGSQLRSLRDLRGRTVVLSEGTVHAKLVPQLAARQNLDINFIFAPDHDASFQWLAEGKADAFANDDIQLHGMLAARDAGPDYRVVGDFLTYADYALSLRRDDPAFADVVDQAFAGLSGSGEIRAIYRRWFLRPLPSGVNLNLRMSPHLEHVFRLDDQHSD